MAHLQMPRFHLLELLGVIMRVLNKIVVVKYWEQCLRHKYIRGLSLSSSFDTIMTKIAPEEDKM